MVSARSSSLPAAIAPLSIPAAADSGVAAADSVDGTNHALSLISIIKKTGRMTGLFL
jgi:hypothetical protein